MVCNRLDSVAREQTTFVLLWGKMWRPAKEVANDYPDDLPDHIDLFQPSRIVFDREKSMMCISGAMNTSTSGGRLFPMPLPLRFEVRV